MALYARSRKHGVYLRAALAAALMATAISQQVTSTQQADQQPQPNIAEVQAYQLTKVPGCDVAAAADQGLPAGIFDTCNVQMPQLKQDDPQVFTFSIADNIQMSAMFTLAVQGGTASMSIWYPGSPLDSPPDLIQNELFSSPASSEGWISIPQEDIATRPGDYILSVTAFSGAPDVTLSLTTPPSNLQLVEEERALLASMAAQCCKGNEKISDSPFCAAIAQKSLAPEHAWYEDMCHLAPSSCNADGQLTKLALPGLGLNCEALPTELGSFTKLARLDLSGNNFAAATTADVEAVVASLPDLGELALGSTGISGNLTCDILTPAMKTLDLAYNFLEGTLPTCLVNKLNELYVPGNALTGVLPTPAATSPLTILYANVQRGDGMTGSVPVAYGSLRRLKYLNIGGNSLSGALPAMPRSLKLLNVSDNNLDGRLGSLPLGIWNVDVGGNSFTGPLPALAALESLEVFVVNSNDLQGRIPALPAGLQHFEASGCGLSGPLPALPAGLRLIDVADNQITGAVTEVDVTNMEVFRAGNNSLTGLVPATAAASPALWLLDLHGNKLTGSLPEDWTAPRLQMIMVEDNALTGTIPSSLAALSRLGVLRLANNKLTGDLTSFAAQIPDPSAAAAAAAGSKPKTSSLFDFNVSANALSGPVPDSLAWLGVFNPNLTIIVPGPAGGPTIAPRVLDLSDNEFEGDWPTWLLDAVPSTTSVCHCSVTINLSGPNNRLNCPLEDLTITDYAWQLAAEQRYKCWSSKEQHETQLLDQLYSSANSEDKIDTTSRARGDGGNYPFTHVRTKPDPKVVAGAVVGVIGGLTLLAVVGYFVVYKRFVGPTAKATAFSKFVDDPAAAAAAGGTIDMTAVAGNAAAASDGAAAHADANAAAAARPM